MSAYAAREVPALTDEHWVADDRAEVFEGDMHQEDDIAYAEAWENHQAEQRCLPGCPHHGRCDNYPF